MHPRFTQKVIIITGASSGFGLAAAQAFLAEGASVALLARNANRLQAAAQSLPPTSRDSMATFQCDVSDRAQVSRVFAEIVARFGRIDILLNNAGGGLIAPVEIIQLPDAVTLFATNFFGAFNCIQAALPTMRRQGRGQIINMASVAGLRGIPNSSMYCASKAALIAFSDSLRVELDPHHIAVSVICPSRTNDTPFVERAKKYGDIQLYQVPETLTTPMVVAAVLDAAANRRRLVVLPFHARLLHALNKFAPRVVDRYLARRMPNLADALPISP